MKMPSALGSIVVGSSRVIQNVHRAKMRPGAAGGKPDPIRQYMRDEMFTLAGRAGKELATERAGSTPGQGAHSFPLCGDNRSSAEPAATTWRNTCPTLGRLTAP